MAQSLPSNAHFAVAGSGFFHRNQVGRAFIVDGRILATPSTGHMQTATTTLCRAIRSAKLSLGTVMFQTGGL